jgi:hypothetical protein
MSSPKRVAKTAARGNGTMVKRAGKPARKPVSAVRSAAGKPRTAAANGASADAKRLAAEAGEQFTPVPRHSISATDVMVTASGLLRAADLAVFELGMWQSWTGR